VTIGFLLGKGLLATLAAMVMRFPRRVAWLAGVGLAQFGEFGFVLTTLAVQVKLVTAQEMAPLLDAGIISMFLTPLVIRIAPHISAGERLLAPLEKVIGVKSIDEADLEASTGKEGVLSGHVVIVGFGVAGRLAVKALKRAARPYLVLELDAERVRAARAEGEPVYYGDATSAEALGHAHLDRARALVLLMNDPTAAQRVVDAARRMAPRVPVLMRTKYVADGTMLRAMGVTEVVAEELEGGVAVASKLLGWLDVAPHDASRHIAAVRKETG